MADDDRPTDEPAPGDEQPETPDRDETAVAPSSDDTTVGPPSSAWSGRAAVPPPGHRDGDGRDGDGAHGGWPEEQPSRPWWFPIVVAVLVLVILAVLGAGIWLITRAVSGGPAPVDTTSPPPTASATPSATPTATTRQPTASETSSATATPSPTTTTPGPTPAGSPTPGSPTPPSPTPPSPTPGPSATPTATGDAGP